MRELAERAYFRPVPGSGAAAPVREVLEGSDRRPGRRASGAKAPRRSTRLSWSGWVVRWSGSWIPACGSSPSGSGRSGSAGSTEPPRCFDSDRCRRHARPALPRWRDAGDLAGGSGAGGVGPEEAIERAVVALAEFHRLGFTHGDAMAENVLVDLEAGVAHWFDFETIHDSSRPMAWRRADDVRALLVTCLVRTVPEKRAGTLQLILDVYADEGVTRLLATSFTSVLRRPLTFHLAQAGLSFQCFREIARLLRERL